MRVRSFGLASLIILGQLISGCMGDKGIDWPDRVDSECEFEFENLSCSVFSTALEIPLWGLKPPSMETFWMIDQSGLLIEISASGNSTLLDFRENVSRCHNEQGLLGFEFSEDFTQTGLILLSYIEDGSCNGDNKAKLILSSARYDGQRIDPASVTSLTSVKQPCRNHNGGHLVSIDDGNFLWGIGDGGSHGDPNGNGQNPKTVLGSIQLLNFINGSLSEVDDDDSPFLRSIHIGLRNPWRFDVDYQNRLWIADVGQNCWEEVNLISSWNHSSNFGWSITEGLHEFDDDDEECEDEEHDLYQESNSNITLPVHEYDHSNGNCSITGGLWMDWGPWQFQDSYIFGDFCSGSIWTLKFVDDSWEPEFLGSTGTMIVSFARGPGDELLILTWGGTVYALSE